MTVRRLPAWLLALTASPVLAQEAQWLAYDIADDAGNTLAQLQFGVAGSQELVFTASCSAGVSDIAVALYVDTGSIPPGDPATVRITTPSHAESRPGAVVEDVFGTHAVAQLKPDDPVWPILAAGLTGTLGVDGGTATAIHLRGSRVAISRFLASCAILAASPAPPQQAAAETAAPPAAPDGDTVAAADEGAGAAEGEAEEPPPAAETADGEAAEDGAAEATEDGAAEAETEPAVPAVPPAAPPQPPYPLYVTGDDPVPAFSAMRFGIVLDPLPPGSTVRRTGNTGVRDGDEWVEVMTIGPRVRTVWVRREQLEPSSAGASAYQNPSPAGTLLMREAPLPDAPVVGEIPARAVGILDQGQRQGDWVMVSFSGTTGWVSHLYLRPIGPELPSDEPPAPPVAAIATAEPYTASFEAWTIDCDPCRDPAAGAVCTVKSPSRATARRQATLTLEPEADGSMALLARYAAEADFPGPGDAILTLTVDATPPQTIAADGWRLDPASGETVIATAALTPLLPAIRGGQTLTFGVSDGARIWTDQFALAGFPPALDALTARLPMPSGVGDEEACPTLEENAAGSASDDETLAQ